MSTRNVFTMTPEELRAELQDAEAEVGKCDRQVQSAHLALMSAFIRERTVRDVMHTRALMEMETRVG